MQKRTTYPAEKNEAAEHAKNNNHLESARRMTPFFKGTNPENVLQAAQVSGMIRQPVSQASGRSVVPLFEKKRAGALPIQIGFVCRKGLNDWNGGVVRPN